MSIEPNAMAKTLVIDDENNRLVLSDCLGDEGHAIIEAIDGEESP